ncbi:MAG TPA: hypothetical protein VFN19_04255 [Candidatus Nanopelagicales bacterium]|nr:hypothetical protein [Candidatus Nanopelagicales bacterium]
MTVRRPLLTATLISGCAVLLAVAAGGAALALLGDPDPPGAATGWTGWTPADSSSHRTAQADRRAATPDDAAALALLGRAGTAAGTLAYTARTVTRSGTGMNPTTTEVVALPGVGTVVRSRDAAAVLAGDGRGSTLADAAHVLGLLEDNYRVVREVGADRQVAGRPALAVQVIRPDGTLAARYWVDEASGLLVRRDLEAAGAGATTTTRVTGLWLGTANVGHLPPIATDGWPQLLGPAELAARRAAGCSCAQTLPGGLTLLQARTERPLPPGEGVTHLLYSDGLTAVSLFDEPGRLDPAAVATLTAQGFTATDPGSRQVLERVGVPGSADGDGTGEWVWQSGGSVLTLVGPASPRGVAQDRLEQVAGALAPPGEAAADVDDGLPARVQRGFDRVQDALAQSWDQLS